MNLHLPLDPAWRSAGGQVIVSTALHTTAATWACCIRDKTVPWLI